MRSALNYEKNRICPCALIKAVISRFHHQGISESSIFLGMLAFSPPHTVVVHYGTLVTIGVFVLFCFVFLTHPVSCPLFILLSFLHNDGLAFCSFAQILGHVTLESWIDSVAPCCLVLKDGALANQVGLLILHHYMWNNNTCAPSCWSMNPKDDPDCWRLAPFAIPLHYICTASVQSW